MESIGGEPGSGYRYDAPFDLWGSARNSLILYQANALKFSPKQAATHLGFSALEGVLSKKAYSLLLHNQQQPPQISVEELETEAWALLPPGTPLPDPKWNDVAGELCVSVPAAYMISKC